jgi:hypothetical protein
VCLPWNAARTARSSVCAACTTSNRRRCSRCVRGVGLDLEVTEGGRETLKGGELVGIDLCHAAKVPIADELGRRVGWVEARSARRSVRGGQNLSARRVGQQQNLTGRHPLHDPRTPYLSRYARFGVACSPSMVEDGCCGGGFGGPRSRAPGLVGTRGLAIFRPKDHPDPPGATRPVRSVLAGRPRGVRKCVHAAGRYSCRRPPSRSRRWTRACGWPLMRVTAAAESGGSSCSARWGR